MRPLFNDAYPLNCRPRKIPVETEIGGVDLCLAPISKHQFSALFVFTRSPFLSDFRLKDWMISFPFECIPLSSPSL